MAKKKRKDNQNLPVIKKLKDLSERELEIVREILILYQFITFLLRLIKLSIIGIVIFTLTSSNLLDAWENILSRFSSIIKAG